MIRLLLADDDAIVRKSLSTGIAWCDHGIDVVGVAKNGEEAINLSESFRPDIVVLDIRMPFVDGIEAATKIRSFLPDTRILFLSGHEDFQYARQGILLNITEYLLKPAPNDVVLDAVLRAGTEVLTRREQRKTSEEALSLLQLRFLRQLVRKAPLAKDIAEGQALGLRFVEGKVLAIVVQPDTHTAGQETNLSKKAALSSPVLASLSCLVPQAFTFADSCLCFEEEHTSLVILLFSGLDPKPFMESAETGVFSLRNHYENKSFGPEKTGEKPSEKTALNFGIGLVHSTWLGINTSFEEACATLCFRQIDPRTQVFRFEQTGLPVAFNQSLVSPSVEKFYCKVRHGMQNEALALLASIKQRIQTERMADFEGVFGLCQQIVLHLRNDVADMPEEKLHSVLDQALVNLKKALDQSRTVTGLFLELEKTGALLCNAIQGGKANQQQKYVRMALEYMEQHFQDKQLSLVSVAAAVNLSPAYLSVIFKTEHGKNFSDCLMEYRIQHAIRLLETCDVKTYEVSEASGFSNPQYFNVCFKKYSGLTPGEYKHRGITS